MLRERIKYYGREGWFTVIKFFAWIRLYYLERSSGSISDDFLIHAYLKRTFKIYLPAGHDLHLAKGLLIVLHGRGGNGESMILLTRNGFNRLADKENYLVVYPDGIEMNWNDGRNDHVPDDRAHLENIDDVGFISSLIDLMINEHNADPARVFVTGISNGAIMAYRLACELSEKITAIAPVNGNMPYSFIPSCKPVNPVSVIAINNTDDPLVPFYGGIIRTGLTKMNLGRVLSTEESLLFWVKMNNCTIISEDDVIKIDDSRDGFRVTRRSFTNSDTNVEVISYTIHGGGHTWPGGLQYLPAIIIGKTCKDLDANELIWAFFRKRSKILQESVNG